MGRVTALALVLGAALVAVPAFSAPTPRVHVIEMRDMAFEPPPKGLRAATSSSG